MKYKVSRQIAICFILLFSIMDLSAKDNPQNADKVDQHTKVSIGQVAPDFTVEMLDGRKITLSDLKGKVVLLNFWATWCPPCMKEFKAIPEKIIKRFENEEDFVLLPISRQEKREVVEKKMKAFKEIGVDFPVGIDPERKIYSKYAIQQIPRNFIIDRKGKIHFLSIGYSSKEFKEMADKIDELLKEK